MNDCGLMRLYFTHITQGKKRFMTETQALNLLVDVFLQEYI